MIDVQLTPIAHIETGHLSQMVALRDSLDIYDSPFFDLDFAHIVASVRRDVFIAHAHDDKGLLGFWPLHVRPGKWARPIGGAFSDWHGPVLRAEAAVFAPEAFLLKAGLKGMTAPRLQPAGLSASWGGQVTPVSIAYLPDGAEIYKESMKGQHQKHYKNLRRYQRLMHKDFSSVEILIEDDSPEAFDWLMQEKHKQYVQTGKHDVLAPDWVQNMMSRLRTARMARLRGRLSTLRLDGKLAAAEFNLLSDKVVHGWITAFDQAYAAYAPGHLLMLGVICNMEETGHKMCDIGDQSYSKYYQSFQKPVENCILRTGQGMRPLARSWQIAETCLPGGLGQNMARLRRRGDQIFTTDIEPLTRARSLAKSLKRAI